MKGCEQAKDSAALNLQQFHNTPHLKNQSSNCAAALRNNAAVHDLDLPVSDALRDRTSVASSFPPRAG